MDAIVLRNVSKEFRKKTIRREYTTLKSELVQFLKRKKPRASPVAVTVRAPGRLPHRAPRKNRWSGGPEWLRQEHAAQARHRHLPPDHGVRSK